MKKILLLMTMVLLLAAEGFSQAPGILNYQGVARNSVGNVLVNKNITLRLTIRDNTAAGPTVYQESRAVTTNPFGLFNVQLGSPGASGVTGTIPGVNWAVGAKFIQVEIDQWWFYFYQYRNGATGISALFLVCYNGWRYYIAV